MVENQTPESSFTRRNFLKGAAAGIFGTAAIGALGGCSPAQTATAQSGSYTYADTVKWDGEYDVLIMGFGGAGAVAAHYAAKNGAEVLLFDVAPEGHEGGNTRYCAQCIAFGKEGDEDKLLTYYEALSGGIEYDEDVLRALVDGMVQIPSILVNEYGIEKVTSFKGQAAWNWGIPEFPELEGSDAVDVGTINGKFSDAALWNLYRDKVYEEQNQIDVWYESPGTALIQDPDTLTILGVAIDRKGTPLNIRARNGVVLACGGFENNPRMVNDYLGLAVYNPIGTLYNRGDGISMVLEAGADLWHMGVYEGIRFLGGAGLEAPMGERSPYGTVGIPGFDTGGSYVLVGSDGSRYVNETYMTRHGHVSGHGEWPHPQHTKHNHLIMDQAHYDLIAQADQLDDRMASLIVQADSIEALAGSIGADPAVLKHTIEKYNLYAQQGEDWEYGRDAATMKEIGSGPYYSFPMVARILNTQGGPRHDANSQVMDAQGNPIPHLYAAGEFGGFTSKNYQGASNMTECLVFGKIAGTNAAEKKDDLALYVAKSQVESDLSYTLGAETDAVDSAEYQVAENEYVGAASGLGGEIVVMIKMDDSTIESVEVLKESETPEIGGEALKKLPQMVLDKQSSDIDAISGASVTSKAFAEAVKAALEKAGA